MQRNHTENMSELNLPSIDFSKVYNVVIERDLKRWKQEAIAKYGKLKYEEHRKQIIILHNKIETYKKKIQDIKDEKPEVEALTERIADSITSATEAIDHLNQRKFDVENEINTMKERYDALIDSYSNAYEEEKKALKGNNSLYKEFEDITVAFEKLKIQMKISNQSVKDLDRVIKMKEKVNQQIINSNIIDFLRAIMYAQKLAAVNKEFAEKRILAQNLIKTYEKCHLNKEPVKSPNVVKTNELPKLTIKPQGVYDFTKFNMPTSFPKLTMPAGPSNKQKIYETKLLHKLSQRSQERQKIIQQRQTSMLLIPHLRKSHHVISKEVPGPVDKITNNQKINVQNTQELNKKSQAKVNVLQNIAINTINETLMKKSANKRPPTEKSNTAVKDKKAKKVSFGEYISQEDQIQNTTDEVEPTPDNVSSFFTKMGNTVNPFQRENCNFFAPEERHVNLTDTHLESIGDRTDFLMKDLNQKDLTNDETFFSMSKSTENVLGQDQDNTFFWSQPTSQQSTAFNNGLNLF